MDAEKLVEYNPNLATINPAARIAYTKFKMKLIKQEYEGLRELGRKSFSAEKRESLSADKRESIAIERRESRQESVKGGRKDSQKDIRKDSQGNLFKTFSSTIQF